jgi:acetoin utilization deacetylase AcuC-like enzyme
MGPAATLELAGMTTLLITHPDALGHDMGAGHPERPDRIRALLQRLDEDRFGGLQRCEAPEATREAVLRAHPSHYLDALLDARPGPGERVRLDADTAMNDGSWPAVIRGAGGAVLAVDQVVTGAVDNAFVAMRPPGHHAEAVRAMGFCFLNNAAIAARHAQAVHGLGRVAIVDFDVHHGNGTQDIFWDDPTVLYCSTHEMPLYPGTGAASERGTHDTIVNAPLRSGDGGEAFRAAMEARILPRIAQFAPDLVIISAGFDAHRRDPLASLALVEDDFAWVTRRLLERADASAGGRVVSLLEGGYDLEGLASSAAAHVGVLMGET